MPTLASCPFLDICDAVLYGVPAVDSYSVLVGAFHYTHESIRTHSSRLIYIARALDSIRNRFIVFTWPGVNSRDVFGLWVHHSN